MACLDDQSVLGFIAGTLDPAAVSAVDEHLDTCPACRELLIAVRSAPSDAAEPAPAAEPGTRFGRFVLLEPIGAGAMGVVYAAYDPELDRRVALKVLTTGDDESSVDRVLVEAQAMAKLSHPNVVTVFDVGRAGQTIFIAMELIDGPTLRGWVGAEPRHWTEVRDVCAQAGRGLAAAHAVGLVHRDCKPDNIIVGSERTRVGDFGLASWAPPATEDQTSTGPTAQPERTGLAGTPAYMAPEQLRGERPTALSDQYSLCASMYEALFGCRAVSGESLIDLLAAAERGDVVLPTDERGVPRWMSTALIRGMNPRPQDRFANIEALLDALHRDRRAKTGLTIGAVALVVVGASAGAYRLGVASPTTVVEPCAGAADALAETWGPERRRSVIAAFVSARPDYGAAVADNAVASVDAWATTWVEHHTEACRASLRQEQSDVLLDARMACLSRRRHDVDALVSQWVTKPGGTADLAAETSTSMPELDSCADLDALAAVVPPPADPEQAERVVQLRGLASNARALLRTGQYEAGTEAVQSLLSAAKAVGYEPLVAEAWALQAFAARKRGALADATDASHEALWAATSARDDHGAVRAWISILQTEVAAGRFAAAPRVARHAEAALRRVGSATEMEATLLNTMGVAFDNLGRRADARDALDRALTLRRERFGGDRTEVAHVLTNLANLARNERRLDESLDLHRQALQIDAAAWGPTHPIVGRHLHNVARLLLLLGRRDEALEHYERALAIKRAAYGEQHVEVARSHNSLGLLFAADGDPEVAAERFGRALAIYQALGHSEEGVVRYNLGLAKAGQGDPAGALALRLGVAALPAVFVLDPEGKPVGNLASVDAAALVQLDAWVDGVLPPPVEPPADDAASVD